MTGASLLGPVDRCICLRATAGMRSARPGDVITHPFCRATVHDCADYDRRQTKVEAADRAALGRTPT